jgi:ATP-dependent Lon protease
MNDKTSLKKEINNKPNDVLPQVDKKIEFFKDVIQKTIIHVQKNKMLDILGIKDVTTCVERLGELSKKIQEMTIIKNTDIIIHNLQLINNDLSVLLKNYGTNSFEDLLLVCFGSNHKVTTNDNDNDKMELLKKYFHPTGYKVALKKDEKKNSNNEIINLTCSDVVSLYTQLRMKVYGIKVYINSPLLNKSLVIFGVVDDIIVDFLNNKYITNKKTAFIQNKPTDECFSQSSFDNFISSLSLNDYLIYDDAHDIYSKYAGYISQNNALKQKPVSQIVKEFISDDIYNKRNTLIQLLIRSSNYENQYLSYLLYDLLSNDSNGTVDTQEQIILFDSFPWEIKQYFKQAMKKTVQYTNELSNFDINKIPFEQQICLLKAPDNVKEKAMMKLKEVKAKSEDSGIKARQYLDGLLKIPFSVYKREPILQVMEKTRNHFKNMYVKYNQNILFKEIPDKHQYTSVEVLTYIEKIQSNSGDNIGKTQNNLLVGNKKQLIANITALNELLVQQNRDKIKYVGLNKEQLREEIIKFSVNPEHNTLLKKATVDKDIASDISIINNNMKQITDYMTDVRVILDKAVHGHDNAKKQVERIIGQWVNGDIDGNKSHVLGFEGNPGIGKTTLAKGLSNCLKDENGNSRPFALIALGGDSNASTLLGFSYTYVGSSWSQLVQTLIDSKCMNPIILFDEVDKISKSDHGKEITGVLTHLLDSTQNSTFQDKYFSGIDLDLSKALFILSYNDSTSIDPILLDRIHRIKFDSLSVEDKIVISNNHLLPELYTQVGLKDMIHFSDEVLKFIIEEYTLEPGIRKLKEKLFEIIGDINLEILKNVNQYHYQFPIQITIEDIKQKFFKDKREVKVHKIHTESKVGLINALWANQMSQGGVLPIQASFVPASKFLELTLTGSMGDVMKESISVSLTNAWNLTDRDIQKCLIERYNDVRNNQVCGIHIHCPDISTKKDGPSATTAFTVLIYSLFNNIKIKHNFGITGETHFGFEITEIGGLQEKIIHSIKSGITEFIFPKENQTDFDKIMKKYKTNKILEGIKFHAVSHIEEVLELILEGYTE